MREKQDHHALLQPRALASVGLLGVGGGVGLALMLSRILVPLGLAVTIASSLCVFWIYARALRSIYRAVTKRIPYRGPKVSELMFANVAAVFLIGTAVAVFSIVLTQEPPAGRATLNIVGLHRVKLPASSADGFINVEIKNQGSLDAEKPIILLAARATSTTLTPDVIKKHLVAASDALDSVDSSGQGSQLRTGLSGIITPREISSPDQWASIASPNPPPGITISDAQWQDFEQAKLAIYVFYIARYQDDGHKNSYWKTVNCVFFIGTTAFWHNCADNRI